MTVAFIINMALVEPGKAIDFACVHFLVSKLADVTLNINWLL